MIRWFSTNKDVDEDNKTTIPKEILSSVNVMGDTTKKSDRNDSSRAEKKPDQSSVSITKKKPVERIASRQDEKSSPFLPNAERVSATLVNKTESKPVIADQATVKTTMFPGMSSQGSTSFDGGFSAASPQKKLFLSDAPKTEKKFLYIGISVLIVILLGGGVGYYSLTGGSFRWVGWGKETKIENVPQPEVPVVSKTEAPSSPYALDQPNYLPIDPEIITPKSFSELFSQIATKIKDARIEQPIEFIVTDQNNNPVAFSRLAYLLKLGLPSAVIGSIDESFSLFLYSDGGRPRVGLGLTLKDPITTQSIITKEEPNLPFELQSLVLEAETIIPKRALFRSSTYNGQAIRFVFIDEGKGTSIDYAFRDQRWMIGTSKNTLRAMLDLQK